MDKTALLKLLKGKMGAEGAAGMGGTSAVLGQISSMIPDIKQNEVIQGKTGLGGTAETLAQQGLEQVVPGLGTALSITSKIGSAIEGDGSSTGKNLVEDIINPLSNINDLAEGRAKYAIPIVGSFLKANDVKNNLAFTADKQLGESLNESKNLNAAYPTFGVNKVQRFELGGSIPLSKDTSLLQGATHQQGGIPLMKQGQQIGEAENNELLINTENNAHIATDKLINPKTNNSFAVDIAKIKQEQGKYEKLQEKRPADGTLKNVIDKSKAETEGLIQEQEMTKQKMLQALKQQMGGQTAMPQQGMPEFKFGGTIYGGGSGMDMETKRQAEEAARLKLLEGFTPSRLGSNVNLDGTTDTQMVNTLNWNPFKDKVTSVQLPVAVETQGKMPDYGTYNFAYPDNINEVIEEGRGYSVGSSQEWDKKPNKMIMAKSAANATGTEGNSTKQYLTGIGESFANKINGVPADILMGLANAFDRKKDKVPQKDGLNYFSPLKVDYGSQKEQAIRSSESTLKALNNSISDATTGRAASLASLSERIGSINNINEAETNTNMQLLQDVLGKNSQIQGLNNETKFSNEVLKQQFKDDKRAKNLQLASRIANESSQRKRDANADKLANQQNFLRAAIEEDPRVLQNAIDSGIFDELFTEEQRKKLLESLKVK